MKSRSWKLFLLPFSTHASMFFNPRTVALGSPYCYIFFISSFPLSETKENPLTSHLLTLVKRWVGPFSACSLLCPHPSLLQLLHLLSLSCHFLWNREGGSEQVGVPACRESQAPISSPPASSLTSPAQVFQQLRYSELLEISETIENLKWGDVAPTLSQVTVSHVMLASLRQVSLGLTVLLCTTGVLEPLPK